MVPDNRSLGAHSIVALIPARGGSKRCPGKNVRDLAGKPLIQHTLELARSCDLIKEIIVSTDDPVIKELVFGHRIHHRKPEHAQDDSPDYQWVSEVLQGRTEDIFVILRPTSPFRTVSTIRRAYAALIGSKAHSIRAVRPVSEHPGKMWRLAGKSMVPILDRYRDDGTPWHSSPTQSLPPYYVQTASLEMGWVGMVAQHRSISGSVVAPFLVDALEAVDVNTESDFLEAERLAATWLR